MCGWWKKRKERKEQIKELRERYPFTTGNPYVAVIWKASQKFSAHVRRYGLTPKSAETIRQYYLRVARINNLDQEALLEFLRILEGSMYSNKKYGEKEKNDSIDQLRKLERSLNSSTGKFDQAPITDIVIVPPEVSTSGFTKDIHPEVQTYRVNRESDVKAMMSRFKVDGNTDAPGISDEVADMVKEGVHYLEFRKLTAPINQNKDKVRGSVFFSKYVCYYSAEIGYRINEVFGRSMGEVRSFMEKVLDGAMVFSAVDGRDFVIPDDVKLSLMVYFPKFQMAGFEESRKLTDSVQVPAVNSGEVEMDIIVDGTTGQGQ
ncbi:MAG: hypothetical protein ACMUHM_07670 [Thermoplasmatota archaeon]